MPCIYGVPQPGAVVDYRKGHRLFNFLCGPRGSGPPTRAVGRPQVWLRLLGHEKQGREGRKSAHTPGLARLPPLGSGCRRVNKRRHVCWASRHPAQAAPPASRGPADRHAGG